MQCLKPLYDSFSLLSYRDDGSVVQKALCDMDYCGENEFEEYQSITRDDLLASDIRAYPDLVFFFNDLDCLYFLPRILELIIFDTELINSPVFENVLYRLKCVDLNLFSKDQREVVISALNCVRDKVYVDKDINDLIIDVESYILG